MRPVLLLLAGAALLAGCGGGGGGGAAEPPRPAEQLRITITAQSSTLSANDSFISFQPGSDFATQINVEVRNASGTAVADGTAVGLSVSDGAIGALSTPEALDEQSTSLTLTTVGGQATAVFHSRGSTGSAQVTASAQLPGTTQSATASVTIVVDDAVAPPRRLELTAQSDVPGIPIGVFGPNELEVTITYRDRFGVLAAPSEGQVGVSVDPVSLAAFTTLDDPETEDVNERQVLIGNGPVDLAGGRGTIFVTEFGLPGVVRVSATAQDDTTGQVFDAELDLEIFPSSTTPPEPFAITLSAFQVGANGLNPVNDGVQVVNGDPENPANLGGFYQLQVFALVTDRRGNPPSTPVPVEFGLVDAPVGGFPETGPGQFLIAGGDGNPREGGALFSAPGGQFLSAGGGVGPGDTLLLFGRDVVGNDDLESARPVAEVLSETQLNIDGSFNANATSGQSQDNGPVIPYAIGRAQAGSISTSTVTSAGGLASAILTYPVSAVGRSLILYAQVPTPDGTLGDVAQGAFPARAPLEIVVSPAEIVANRTRNVEVCAFDGGGVPIPGVSFRFASGGGGGVFVDGVADSGTVEKPTGFDGCTIAEVRTVGVNPDVNFDVLFEAGRVAAPLTVTGASELIQVDVLPQAVIGNNAGVDFTIRVSDAIGAPLPGVNLNVDCSSSQGTITPAANPPVTDENGESPLTLVITGLDALCPDEQPGQGQCLIDTTSGSGSPATITVRGREGILLPSDPACGGTPEEFALTVDFFELESGNNPPGLNTAVVFSDTGAIACEYDVSGSSGPSGECSANFEEDTVVELELQLGNVPICAVTDTEGCFVGWSGADGCRNPVDGSGVPLLTVAVRMNEDKACIARFK